MLPPNVPLDLRKCAPCLNSDKLFLRVYLRYADAIGLCASAHTANQRRSTERLFDFGCASICDTPRCASICDTPTPSAYARPRIRPIRDVPRNVSAMISRVYLRYAALRPLWLRHTRPPPPTHKKSPTTCIKKTALSLGHFFSSLRAGDFYENK